MVTWNFLEAGHGKGPADGVGAAIKCHADAIVAQGIDIPNGKVLYEKLRDQPSSVQLMYITEEDLPVFWSATCGTARSTESTEAWVGFGPTNPNSQISRHHSSTWGTDWKLVCGPLWWNPYTGLIQDVNSENGALVKTMSQIGKNRWYWLMNDDIIWYQPEDVVRLVPEPQPVTKLHMMLDPLVWEEVLTELDCEWTLANLQVIFKFKQKVWNITQINQI